MLKVVFTENGNDSAQLKETEGWLKLFSWVLTISASTISHRIVTNAFELCMLSLVLSTLVYVVWNMCIVYKIPVTSLSFSLSLPPYLTLAYDGCICIRWMTASLFDKFNSAETLNGFCFYVLVVVEAFLTLLSPCIHACCTFFKSSGTLVGRDCTGQKIGFWWKLWYLSC